MIVSNSWSIMAGLTVKAIYVLATSTLLAQAVPVTDVGVVGSIERLGLLGALLIAVGVLWRALNEKDKQLIAMTGEVTKIMTLVMEAVKELRGTVNELRDDRRDDHRP